MITVGSYTSTMQEFPPSLLQHEIPTLLVDSRSACLAEAGEIIAARLLGESLIELGEMVGRDGGSIGGIEELRGRLRGGGKGMSLFKCVGVGGMDVAITELIVREARRLGLGTIVPY